MTQRARGLGIAMVGIVLAITPQRAMGQTVRSSPPPGAVAAPPERTSGNLPRYPDDAKQRGIGGVVTLDLAIDAGGHVTDVRAVRAMPMLEAAAVTAVRGWQYKSSTTPPTATKVTVVFLFDAATTRVEEARRIDPQGPQPRKTKTIEPSYPAALAGKGTRVMATFDIVVNSAGRVIDLQPKKVTSGFESSARDAIRQWEYEPLMVGGAAVPFVATVTVIISR